MKVLFTLLAALLIVFFSFELYAENYKDPEISMAIENLDSAIAEEVPSVDVPDSASQMQTTIEKIMNKLPNGKLKRGLNKYFEVLGLNNYTTNVGVENSGLARYLEKSVGQNSCFGQMAHKFYDEVKQYDDTKKSEINEMSIFQIPLSARVGQRPYKETEPGWLWQKAIRMSQYDGNLAISLIAVCGHDDVMQGKFYYVESDPEIVGKIFQKIDKLRTEAELKISENNSDSEEVKTAIKTVDFLNEAEAKIKKYNGIGKKLYCPLRVSSLYLPQSLGKDIDISDEMKAKIVEIQAPKEGATAMPAKYYHVYGAAFMACQLIQQGVSPKIAEILQMQAARGYRGLRICEITNDYVAKRSRLEKIYLAKHTGEENFHEFVIHQVIQIRQQIENRQDVSDVEMLNELNNISLPMYDLQKNEEQLVAIANTTLANLDASVLYRKWFLGEKEVGGIKTPCTDFGIVDPTKLVLKDEWKDFIEEKVVCESSWPKVACERARKLLAIWKNDFAWTIAEHKVGAKFAAKVCRELKPDENVFANACGIKSVAMKKSELKRQPSSKKQKKSK